MKARYFSIVIKYYSMGACCKYLVVGIAWGDYSDIVVARSPTINCSKPLPINTGKSPKYTAPLDSSGCENYPTVK